MVDAGMSAVVFWSTEPPARKRGYPPALAVVIVSIAITTCMVANFLLAHVATNSRNKLAEIVWTRKELWRTIAQKENAEAAAAARSDFIASASHEIRTPLHHLQGYSDLLSRTELTEEGRMLLAAIQHATKTLSLSKHFPLLLPVSLLSSEPCIRLSYLCRCSYDDCRWLADMIAVTNNVLDWSKLERDSEAVCRPIYLDMRTVCESILMLLPNRENEADVDLLVVVSPDVPDSLFLDETYIQRILMNLLSNALKFTNSGYILLLVEIDGGNLVTTVRDTGFGIPESFLPDLFEPFKQAQTRGSQRGTGLGLSIIRQLLHKMQGSIDVESKHISSPGVQQHETGSTFTIKVPVALPEASHQGLMPLASRPKVAFFNSRLNIKSAEGLCKAWEAFGFDFAIVEQDTDLDNTQWKYIWVDFQVLEHDPALIDRLAQNEDSTVLIPYDDLKLLQQYPKILSVSHFTTLPRPLVWHSFEQRIAIPRTSTDKPGHAKGVRFADNVDVLDRNNEKTVQQAPFITRGVVLLVEDNPVSPLFSQCIPYTYIIPSDQSKARQKDALRPSLRRPRCRRWYGSN